jgi:hypothetical protein
MTGDSSDILSRLKSVLPARWFGDTTPILDAVLSGLATSWSGLYGLLSNVKTMTRIATATGIFLDIASTDYFGFFLPRRAGEGDAVFSARIRSNLVAPRATRAGLSEALENLTGRAPIIFETLNASDTGGYNSNSLGYGTAGGYGTKNLPFQFFVTAYRPNATPISNAGGYNTAPMFYADTEQAPGAISDADIYAAAAAVLPVASIAWTKISN